MSHRTVPRLGSAALAVVAIGCGGGLDPRDADGPDGSVLDGSVLDGSVLDASVLDAFVAEAGPSDAGVDALVAIDASAGALVAEPAWHDFGSFVLGAASEPRYSGFVNHRFTDTGVLSLALEGPGASSFQIVTDTCTGARLVAGSPGGAGQCWGEIVFAPIDRGDVQAVLTLAEDGAVVASVTLMGEGLEPSRFVVAPDAISFGTHVRGDDAPRRELTVTNVGSLRSEAPTAHVVGPDADIVLATAYCPIGLAPGASCSVAVSLVTVRDGPVSATLEIDGAAAGVVHVPIDGVIVGPPELAVRPPGPFWYPDTEIGARTDAAPFVVSNEGGSAAEALSVTLSEPGSEHFVVEADECSGRQLEPNAACTIAIAFRPRSGVLHNTVLRVSSAPTLPSLNGFSFPRRAPTVDPNGHAFGTVPVGSPAPTQRFEVTNPSTLATGPLTFSTISAPAFTIIDNTCTTLAPGELCTFDVSASTEGPAGTVVGELTITAPDVPRVSVSMSIFLSAP